MAFLYIIRLRESAVAQCSSGNFVVVKCLRTRLEFQGDI